MHSEPLSEKVIHELLPQLQQNEKDMVEAGSAHFYGTARVTTRITSLDLRRLGIAGRPARLAGLALFLDALSAALKSGADAIGSGKLTHRIPVRGYGRTERPGTNLQRDGRASAPGAHRARRAPTGTERSEGRGRIRQPRQEPVPGQHEPRAAHADERHHRL